MCSVKQQIKCEKSFLNYINDQLFKEKERKRKEKNISLNVCPKILIMSNIKQQTQFKKKV